MRALGADHPVPLRVKEVGLVRELQDGAARIKRGLHLLPDPLRHLLLREVGRVPRHGAAQLVHRQPVPALVARARVPPAAPPAPDDHRHVDQVLVVLVAEEALAQLGQPVLSALQGAHELLLPVAQQDVVVGPLADEGLVVVEVLAGRPQAQVGVVVLARPGQLPVRAREQRARAPPSAASVICCRCLAQLAILFLRGQFFLLGRAFSPGIPARVAGENSFLHDFPTRFARFLHGMT